MDPNSSQYMPIRFFRKRHEIRRFQSTLPSHDVQLFQLDKLHIIMGLDIKVIKKQLHSTHVEVVIIKLISSAFPFESINCNPFEYVHYTF